MYPEYAEINGKEYKIDTDFNVALKCFEVVEDDTITDFERGLAVVYLLFDFIPENIEECELFLEKAKIYLQCGKSLKEQNDKKPDMDFFQDKNYIMSSFMSDYQKDISKEKMHFWQYVDLIEGLTDKCSLNRIRDIRNFDLSQEKDAKRRREIQEAKKQVALKPKVKPITEEQRKDVMEIYQKLGLRRE